MSVKMAVYLNRGDADAEVAIGTTPGAPPSVYRCGPGKTVEGPANYVEAFARAGLVPAPADVEAKPAEPPMKEPAPLAVVSDAAPVGVVIPSAPAPAVAAPVVSEPKAAPAAKGKKS